MITDSTANDRHDNEKDDDDDNTWTGTSSSDKIVADDRKSNNEDSRAESTPAYKIGPPVRRLRRSRAVDDNVTPPARDYPGKNTAAREKATSEGAETEKATNAKEEDKTATGEVGEIDYVAAASAKRRMTKDQENRRQLSTMVAKGMEIARREDQDLDAKDRDISLLIVSYKYIAKTIMTK